MIPPTCGEWAAKQNKKDDKITETIFNNLMISSFIFLPEIPRLLSLGMNGTRNEASEAGEVEENPA